MYRWVPIALLIIVMTSGASVFKQKEADSNRVHNQYAQDVLHKKLILKKIATLMKEINANIGNTELIEPVEPKQATDVVDHDEYLPKKKVPQKQPTPEKKFEKEINNEETLIAPAQGKKTSKYGYRENPVTKKYAFHKGIDIAAPKGTQVVASASGKVVTSQYMKNGYGNCIIIEHDNAVKTLYAHLDIRIVKVGDTVTQGQKIGTVGATGRATGPHLHYEVYKGNKHIDPDELVHY
ncbi:MAG: M23 family metallopeptidase [Spirochaetota bacterium]